MKCAFLVFLLTISVVITASDEITCSFLSEESEEVISIKGKPIQSVVFDGPDFSQLAISYRGFALDVVLTPNPSTDGRIIDKSENLSSRLWGDEASWQVSLSQFQAVAMSPSSYKLNEMGERIGMFGSVVMIKAESRERLMQAIDIIGSSTRSFLVRPKNGRKSISPLK